MAWIGLPFYGYCPMTVTTNDDGTEQESLGTGKITPEEMAGVPHHHCLESGHGDPSLELGRE